MKNLIYIDTETTGFFDSGGELLELAIIDDDGKTLINQLFQPKASEWPEAQKIHGITPEMVSDMPTPNQLRATIEQIICDKTVVMYNAAFDNQFLERHFNTKKIKKTYCAMETFAPIYGEWNDYFSSYTWQKLTTATAYVGYSWPTNAHRALADCHATKAVWDWMRNYYHSSPQYLLDIFGSKKSDAVQTQ